MHKNIDFIKFSKYKLLLYYEISSIYAIQDRYFHIKCKYNFFQLLYKNFNKVMQVIINMHN